MPRHGGQADLGVDLSWFGYPDSYTHPAVSQMWGASQRAANA
jgi:hypothetical protein